VKAPPETVWEVLADGWLFPLWVVGASRMREVDAHWPAAGARIHHSVGVWPALLDDDTEVVECTPGIRLVLKAKVRPFGEAVVTLTLEPTGAETRIVMEEDVAGGPGRLVPDPLRSRAIDWRNVESLRRLAYLVERRPVREPVG
jgi:uncharacterized protein YndB with AHSA1/START domain